MSAFNPLEVYNLSKFHSKKAFVTLLTPHSPTENIIVIHFMYLTVPTRGLLVR